MSSNSATPGDSHKSELYEKSVEELKCTLNNILDSHMEINQRAIDLVKINILSLSVIVAGVSFSGLNVTLTFISGFVSFLYSIWSSVQVYRPREFKRGIGRRGGISMDRTISSGIDETKFYRKLHYSYIDAIEEAKKEYKDEKKRFQNGLWASIAAILFLSFAGIIHVIGDVPSTSELPLLFIIPIIVFWGKDNTLE